MVRKVLHAVPALRFCYGLFVEYALALVVAQAALDVCEDDWDTVGFPINDEVFCQAAPWTFDVPLYAGWTAIAHVRNKQK